MTKRLMSAFHLLVISSAIAFSTGSTSEAGLLSNAGRILKVERLRVPRQALIHNPSLQASRLPKFMDKHEGVPHEVFHVYWKAPREGTNPGMLVTFEYRQERGDGVRFLHVKYPLPVRGRHTTVFDIGSASGSRYGAVTEWRARMVWRGWLLAETTSQIWSDT
jgi:hypothetical protein